MTGGFAGGEAGLRQFVDEGEVKFKQDDDSSMSCVSLQLLTACLSLCLKFFTAMSVACCILPVLLAAFCLCCIDL